MRRLVPWMIVVLVGCSGTAAERHEPAEPAVTQPQDSSPSTPAATGAEPLRFTVSEAGIVNHFYRDDEIAAHLVVRSGARPRVLTAFPAGNTGVGLWMTASDGAALSASEPEPVRRDGALRGVSSTVSFDQPARIDTIALGSIRHLRDVNAGQLLPKGFDVEIEHEGASLLARRASLSGEHHYALELRAEDGTRIEVGQGGIARLVPPAGQPGRVEMTFLHDHEPLTPISLERLLTDDAAPLEREREVLAFLAYEEKLLAGSWRFLTYFGRDTLFSTRLLMPALEPVAIEGALGSVIDRLSPDGEVAHEESIGDFAAWENRHTGNAADETPRYDYQMVDDDFLLAPVLLAYLETPAGAERAAAFFARQTPAGRSYADALKQNLDFVLAQARPFADRPLARNLIALRGVVGDWRDSQEGLGGGRYAYSVNAALVPAALEAAAALYAAPPLDDPERAAEAKRLAEAWGKARTLFEVTVAPTRARKAVAVYAKRHELNPGVAAQIEAPLRFWAVALDRRGRPIPVAHSDIGFDMLFSAPEPAELERMAQLIIAPFPVGLRTPVGVVVANAAQVREAKLRETFGPDSYHGAVVWSWQQAVLAAGLARQLERSDLPDATRERLVAAQKALWKVIDATANVRAGEYWSWRAKQGEVLLHHPGQGQDHESNAAQLWSTVYLAVKPPR